MLNTFSANKENACLLGLWREAADGAQIILTSKNSLDPLIIAYGGQKCKVFAVVRRKNYEKF